MTLEFLSNPRSICSPTSISRTGVPALSPLSRNIIGNSERKIRKISDGRYVAATLRSVMFIPSIDDDFVIFMINTKVRYRHQNSEAEEPRTLKNKCPIEKICFEKQKIGKKCPRIVTIPTFRGSLIAPSIETRSINRASGIRCESSSRVRPHSIFSQLCAIELFPLFRRCQRA